jgi:hypothetical protein
VWRSEDEKFRSPQYVVELGRRIELVQVERRGLDSLDMPLDSDDFHSQGEGDTSDLSADEADPNDSESSLGEIGARVTFPMLAFLIALNTRELLVEHQHRQETKLSQRLSVDPSSRSEERFWQTSVIAATLDELADAGARRLNPKKIGCEDRQILMMRGVEIEEDVRLIEVTAPAGFLLLSAFEELPFVVGGISRPPQQVGLVDDVEPGVHLLDTLDVLRLQVARDENAIPILFGHDGEL